MTTYAGEPLNILHTIGLETMYPTIRCQLDFANQLDHAKLIAALTAVTKIVPELLCKYQLSTNSFEPVTDDVTDLLRVNVDQPDVDAKSFDLMNEPQLRIYWNTSNAKDHLIFYVSHILTDGAGFKQFLYLLAQAYSAGPQSINGITNQQGIDWLIHLVNQTHRTAARNADHPAAPLLLPKLAETTAVYPAVGTVKLNANMVLALQKKAHTAGVTLNDIFMSAFGRAIQRYGTTSAISLACPTDMRPFGKKPATTRRQIANFTSRYNLNIETDLDAPFALLVHQVHQGMVTNKNNKQCFDSIADLLANYQKYPLAKLQQIVEENYHVREIAYTNFGIIDDDQLVFQGAPIDNVTLTGSFRRAPMFQIAVATFKQQTTLAFNMDGTSAEYNFGLAIARSMADLIEGYTLQP